MSAPTINNIMLPNYLKEIKKLPSCPIAHTFLKKSRAKQIKNGKAMGMRAERRGSARR